MSAQNYTIDDAYWGTPGLVLSTGWNMLRTNGSDQYLNTTQVNTMTPLLGNFWNNSISWTTTMNASTTIVFVGTDIWAYGMGGPNCGDFLATLDNATVGSYSSSAPSDNYHQLLFAAHGLTDAPHELTLTNAGQGTWLAFDVAIISSTLAFENSTEQAAAEAAAAASESAAALAAASASLLAAASASAVAAAEAVGFTWSAAQLASLSETYTFHWTSAAYFVVSFSAMIIACLMSLALTLIVRGYRGRTGRIAEGESYVAYEGKRRPATRILEALKGRKISTPVPMSAEGSEFTTASGKGDKPSVW